MTALLIVQMLLDVIEKLKPDVEAAVKRGDVPVEQQTKVWDRANLLFSKTGGAFDGPEWRESGK